ncbi:hypothetical protein ABB27_10065 [Stenotrophomonas terrae]|uniref:Uncharacterized protein n=1 Tax=Stenotrophomonas terrae TaxID=405446 RepID=A0A0R0CEN3_9GAMM|nr:hypothetical protein ABB27_10065 [Stenotrophomonas terrae]
MLGISSTGSAEPCSAMALPIEALPSMARHYMIQKPRPAAAFFVMPSAIGCARKRMQSQLVLRT